MHGLEVIRTEHEDDERQRRVHLDFLSKPQQPVAPRQERIFEDRPATVQAILQNSYPTPAFQQRAFEYARPSLIKAQSLAGRGDDAPGK